MSGLPAHTARDHRNSVLDRFWRRPLEPNSEQVYDIETSTQKFAQQALVILNMTQQGREQSLALTALEEAKFWTNQAIAISPPRVRFTPLSPYSYEDAKRDATKVINLEGSEATA